MKIKVVSKVGDTVHPKYGRLVAGEAYEIDREDLAPELFEPAGKKKPAGGKKEG